MTSALLLSGGMDSVCITHWKRPCFGITIDYGHNPAPGEIRAASAVCNALDIEHIVLRTDISDLGDGDLVGKAPTDGAPASEWWPYRNQFLLTLAAMKCHSIGASVLMIGTIKTDSFHADGTAEFIDQMNRIVEIQEGELKITAPGIKYTAKELVRVSETPLDILSWAHSCYVSEIACGFCRGCRKHYETMEATYGTAY